ncbi:putative lipopolysaccharide biosynthesis tyrosine kinase [Psychrobacter arcticus 273-4]|uniref:Putative lipopolysaccharide biosynthesis tyrosine kinase n=1 Tax=Psychrobacter arcticus (strain DSM 17307 / VKM B-2377 / 273-4) TaxID=259536 RepID=Q4FU00_PSYA2|nr:polysaccharide biosynthesis tyrosine autokinase [Psychrobacter arcticus]AAZ18508.1 putative lipopolysaccharide biosynthesis tyrosine kinase [Psychrobacter arcticus 273-4]
MNTDSNNVSNSASKKDSDETDLMALLFAILRDWKVIVFFAVLGLLIGVLYSRYENPTFKSDALIQIENNSQGISALGENISGLVTPEDSTALTETELIKSRMVLKPVVDLLHLDVRLNDPAVNSFDRIKTNRTSTQVNTAEGVTLDTADGQVRISQFDVSQAYLNQSFTLVKSDKGFTLSNGFDDFKGQLNQPHRFRGSEGIIQITVAELPADNHPINISKQSLQNATDAINGALTVVEKGGTGILQLSLIGSNQPQITLILKQIILSYMAKNESRSSEQTIKTLRFMETQMPLLKQQLETSEELFNNFREKSGTIDIGQEASLLVGEKSQIDSQLNELKLKKADLTTYYTEEHPLVIQINDQIAVLNNRRQEIEDRVAGLPEIQREFLKLSEDTIINREIYLTMLKNYQQLKIVKAGQVGYARIIDMPISTYRTIAPKKQLIIMIATLSGIMLGLLLVFLRNFLRNTVKDPERLEAKTGIPVIATIPRSPLLTRLRRNKNAPNRLLAYVDNNSLSYEAIKSLRTNLMFGMPAAARAGQRAKVILITGESPGVGKSFISSNLTEVLAQLDKKTLIIDADMRLGELHKVFNMDQHNGLADYLTQDTTHLSRDNTQLAKIDTVQESSHLASFIHSTGIDNIDFMPRGEHPRNPASLLANGSFDHLMADLNLHYDYIIIDSPPILAASDAMILAQHADKVLMVTRYESSIEGQLVYAVNQMNKANIKVDGIILNDVQQGIMSKYSYHYSYAYGNNN